MSTTTTATTATDGGAKRRGGHGNRDSRLLIWLFLAPTVIGLGLFQFLPILGSVGLAFFRWDIITPPQFVGFDNFVELATNPTVRVSFFNTITFVHKLRRMSYLLSPTHL